MARRSPLVEMKKKYFKNLTIREIHPWLFYHKCVKCGDEFCRETMYGCEERSVYFEWWYHYEGCTHCFNSKDEFKKYLEDKGTILTEKDFIKYSENLLH